MLVVRYSDTRSTVRPMIPGTARPFKPVLLDEKGTRLDVSHQGIFGYGRRNDPSDWLMYSVIGPTETKRFDLVFYALVNGQVESNKLLATFSFKNPLHETTKQ